MERGLNYLKKQVVSIIEENRVFVIKKTTFISSD